MTNSQDSTPLSSSEQVKPRERTQRARRGASATNSKTFVLQSNNELRECKPVPFDASFPIFANTCENAKAFGFIFQPGLVQFTLPRYNQQSFYLPCRGSHDFDAAYEALKVELGKWDYTPSIMTNLYRHEQYGNLFVYVKRYTNAHVLGLYILKYYNGATPVLLDLR